MGPAIIFGCWFAGVHCSVLLVVFDIFRGEGSTYLGRGRVNRGLWPISLHRLSSDSNDLPQCGLLQYFTIFARELLTQIFGA